MYADCFFFFSSRRRHTRLQGDWSSDVCSSDLVNPPWQHGGVSPIRLVEIAGTGARSIVNVNGRALLTSLTPAMARGTASFGLHGETEITRYLAEGRVPNRLSARDEEGLAAAALIYNVHLDPGEQRDEIGRAHV